MRVFIRYTVNLSKGPKTASDRAWAKQAKDYGEWSGSKTTTTNTGLKGAKHNR